MRIGILTHHFIANYGAFLQAYALQEAIKKGFPNDEVFIINYIHFKHFIINNGGWFRFYKNRETIGAWWQKIHLPLSFFYARHQFLNLTKRCFNCQDVNKLKLDVIVVGSDEVWNFKDSKSNASIKFGKGLKCKRIIAYAPSVGNSTINDIIPEYVRKGLHTFSSISVRDSLGQQLVEHLIGQVPIKVLDPTFLIDLPTETVNIPKKDYILFYYADNLPHHIKSQIFSYAKDHNLNVYGAGEYDKQYTDITVNLTPFQWVWMFKNAKFIITGTFHGVVFSIINNKQFKVYLTQKNRIRKVNDLLESLGIKNRNIENDFVLNLDYQGHEIDYTIVNKRMQNKVDESLTFLKNAIKCP